MSSPPQQARSIATEKKMLDAAEELLQSGDARNVTLENVVKLSGASMGSFYARFGSVEGLFEALHQRYLDSIYSTELLEAMATSRDQPDLRSALHHTIKTLLQFGVKKRRLLSYFITQLDHAGLETRRAGINTVHEILKAHRSEVVHKDLRRASINTSRLIYQTFIGIILLEPSEFDGRKTSLASIVETTTQMAYLYLTNE
ncbi:MAG: TetR/AcrR family transcriptional regulator [Actinomycetes bacterium]|jgi:AcrR family transcriptional regulator